MFMVSLFGTVILRFRVYLENSYGFMDRKVAVKVE